MQNECLQQCNLFYCFSSKYSKMIINSYRSNKIKGRQWAWAWSSCQKWGDSGRVSCQGALFCVTKICRKVISTKDFHQLSGPFPSTWTPSLSNVGYFLPKIRVQECSLTTLGGNPIDKKSYQNSYQIFYRTRGQKVLKDPFSFITVYTVYPSKIDFR